MENLLDKINQPDDIKKLDITQLEQLATEIRDMIIRTVSRNGGHLASNLGAVELTLALLAAFNFCRDKIVFDVGHQVYTWKILTGRREKFCTLRQYEGLAGFPKQNESDFDFFNTGHSSTSISAALGLSRAMSHRGRAGRAIAVIGDGALTGGMSFEALNDAGQSGEKLIVIINDNQMSISRNVGGLSRHLENLRISPRYIKMKSRVESVMNRIPLLGKPFYRLLLLFKRVTRLTLQQRGILFEQLGFSYYGPIDGHDLDVLIHHMRAIQDIPGPVILHVLTQKGKGYRYAEESPDLYHGVAPFVIENGLTNGVSVKPGQASYSEVFGSKLVELAGKDARICAISAAMTAGTGLNDFAAAFPARFYDVGIAEQHAMTLAAGLAAGGMRPVIALYSTFLQRAYDQLLHDICLQCLPVVIAIDRAGIVGEDGETHQGIYDLGLLLPLPGLEVFCPVDFRSLEAVLEYAVRAVGPVAIRYPRGRETAAALPYADSCLSGDRIHKAFYLRHGQKITLAALGSMAGPALEAADLLAAENLDADILAFISAKPADIDALVDSARRTGAVVFLEESVCSGGFAQSLLPDLLRAVPRTRFRCLGVKDQPLCQGSRKELMQKERLSPAGIADTVRDLLRG